jgi:DNA-binding GntR family transcriptional regulator
VLVLLSQTIVALLRTERLYRDDSEAVLPGALDQHREIIHAIADRDGDRAASAMADHLTHVALPATTLIRHNGVTRAAS